MASTSLGVLFLFAILGGGTSDLLDVVPTDDYWRAKNVQVTEAALRAELAAAPPVGDIAQLLEALGDDVAATRDAAADKIRGMGPAVIPALAAAAKGGNPEVAGRARRLMADVRSGGSKAAQVRKLMAVRTAGEKKLAGLLPRLKELTAAPEPFVADYAAAAVAAIEGKPYARPRPAAGADDAWLLPVATRAIVHLNLAGPSQPATAAGLARLVKMMPTARIQVEGAPPPDLDKEAADQAQAMIAQVIAAAERVGNARLESVTMGVSGEVGNNSGFVAFVVRGQYDAKAVGDYLAEQLAAPGNAPAGGAAVGGAADAPKREALAGVDVFRPASSAAILLASNTHAGFVAGPGPKQMPVEELAGLLKAGKAGPLKDVPEMAKLVAEVDPSLPLWGAAQMTAGFRQAPLFRGLDSLLLTARAKGDGVALRVEARGANGPAVAEAVAMVNQGVEQANAFVKPMADALTDPEMKKLAKVGVGALESLKCAVDAADPTKASLTVEVDAPPGALLGGLAGMVGGVRSEVRREGPPPVAPPAPAPAPPQ
jgi:hypothetical protein